MTQNFTPLLSATDWNEEWKRLQIARRKADNSEYWDKRSKTFSTKDAPNAYVDRFLELARIEPGETVFDMGCGTGALSVPLGEEGHKVVAADFSQGMLDAMEAELREKGVTTVFPKLMSWEDDWEAHGVHEGMTDVALASRSIAVSDMKAALMRLTSVARRRVCITLSTGSSPRMDERILADIGVKNQFGNDFLYAFNILVGEGIMPEVAYIKSTRSDTFDSVDEAYDDFSRMTLDAMADKESPEAAAALDRLRTWTDAHLVANPDAGNPDKKGLPQKAFKLDYPRIVTWAFLAWDAR
ncbi:class I SAM-dependent methyltransferase [Raoultibacter massiliensis]|uniref:Methyltransferase domain-containing protein n=1 Tax=Raoultibacter massiliensis TaxID=1852371 RepID=A0ABV1JCQ8_9ACTN|nr:methyltransferase domain-containing protein [Raoultibacter massiliensis]